MPTADTDTEVNFDSIYQRYDNLKFICELGYIHLWLRECPAYTLLYQFSPKDTGQNKVK